MEGMQRALARAVFVLALACLFQSNSCKFAFSSGDSGEDDDGNDDGARTETIVLPPLRDPFGRPMTGAIPIVVRVTRAGCGC